jgi:hypothetical protein
VNKLLWSDQDIIPELGGYTEEYHEESQNSRCSGSVERQARRVGHLSNGVRFPAMERDFTLLHVVHTGSGAHSAVSPGLKRPRRAADHLYASNAEVKNGCTIHPLKARCE